MLVTCYDNDDCALTSGKEYEILATEYERYKICNDNDVIKTYYKYRFQSQFQNAKGIKGMTTQSKVSYHVLSDSLVVAFNGKHVTLNKADVRYATVLQAIKDDRLNDIPSLCDVAKSYATQGLVLKDNLLWLDGEALSDAVSERILVFQKEGIPFDNLIKFARKLRANPSYNSREQLYKFLQHNGHPITTEGNFIAYRGVREDFKDKHTGTFDNSPGQMCEMPRQEVDDNPNNTCSRGLHVACYDYAKGFAPRLVEVEVDPRDVVCVPTDYNGTKMRTCKFKVVQVVTVVNESPLVASSYEETDEFSGQADPVDLEDESEECLIDCECDEQLEEEDQDEWEQVQLKPSELVEEATWERSTKTLEVVLTTGDTYSYRNVPEPVISEWEESSSTGRYYNNFIANSYTYSRI